MSNNAISLQDVTIGYPARHHSHHIIGYNIQATAPKGTMTCIIGRNGTGKSTLLRSIARLQNRLGGDILLNGHSIDSYAQDEFARLLSIVLTSRPDAQSMTVYELVALGRTPYTGFWGRLGDKDRKIVDHALYMVGIQNMSRRHVCSLSDGECQKVMIAKSLAQGTPIILLDEPTAFLDFHGKVELLTLLRRLAHNEGKTILLSTHDLEAALQTADRLWMLDKDGIHEGEPKLLVANGDVDRYIGQKGVSVDEDFRIKISVSDNNN